MIKAGGILAIIAGLLGVLAGLMTLFMGGLGAAFSTDGAGMVVGMGWGGILFSLLVVVYGAIAFTAPRAGATGLALSAIAGMVLGGTLVAVLMIMVLIAALMVGLGKPKATDGAQVVVTGRWRGIVAAAIAPVLCTVLIGGQVFGSKTTESASAAAPTGQVVALGQTTRSPQFEVTVRGIQFMESVGRGFSEKKAEPGTVFVVLDVLVRCVDKESRFYTVGDLLVEMDGKELKFDHSETVLGVASPTGSINPMTEKAGFVVYAIPTAAANVPWYWTPGRGFDKVRFALNAPASPVAAAAPAALPSPPAEVPATTSATGGSGAPADLAGSYTDPGGGTLEIKRQANGQLNFSLEVFNSSGNTGEAAGVLTPIEGGYIYRNDEFECTLNFRLAGNSIAVAQKGMCGFGMNVSAEGNYRKQPG